MGKWPTLLFPLLFAIVSFGLSFLSARKKYMACPSSWVKYDHYLRALIVQLRLRKGMISIHAPRHFERCVSKPQSRQVLLQRGYRSLQVGVSWVLYRLENENAIILPVHCVRLISVVLVSVPGEGHRRRRSFDGEVRGVVQPVGTLLARHRPPHAPAEAARTQHRRTRVHVRKVRCGAHYHAVFSR